METINRLVGSSKNLRIKVLGVGGAGGAAVTHLACDQLAGVSCAVLNTDAVALGQSHVEQRLLIGNQNCRGLGTGGDPERGRAAAEEDAAAIRALCADADLVFLVAGLGGGTGSGAAPVIARIARESKALVLGVVMTPFDFEGARRQRQAALALQELKSVADAVICLPNQKLLHTVDGKTPLPDALKKLNGFVADAVRSIWTLLSRPGIVQVDFAGLCAVTQGRHAESSLAIGRGMGEGRATQALEQLMAHPLIDQGALLSEATTVLVSIVAGPGLAMGEVHEIVERISRAAESAHVVMGAVIDECFGEQLTVTVIVGHGEAEAHSRLNPTSASVEDKNLESAPTSGRVISPPIISSAEKPEQTPAVKMRKPGQRLRQSQLPLEIISRGRFEKSEPTIHHGQDLDVPTYIRRGVALN